MDSFSGMLTFIMLPVVLGIGIVAAIRYALRAGRGEALQKAAAGMK